MHILLFHARSAALRQDLAFFLAPVLILLRLLSGLNLHLARGQNLALLYIKQVGLLEDFFPFHCFDVTDLVPEPRKRLLTVIR